ncbi:hypothetical protein HJG60_009531 [Phyllostomus discolor]|uniref:Uncharacterized protein n=1 Tax=Phyllostomus discolor TaxID=89673 RepID=A0A833YJ99_9CHIR|nr:hypothetical protein HJG60_009531 [Phyllostomus discolor]
MARVLRPPHVRPRLVAKLQDTPDTSAAAARKEPVNLQRLLWTWEPAKTLAPEPTPGPETNEEAPVSPMHTQAPTPQGAGDSDPGTGKGISKAGERDKASGLKCGTVASSSVTTTASAPGF